MSHLLLHPRFHQCNVRSQSPFGHVHMFAVIMITEEENTEDCVIMIIATYAHDPLVITPHHRHELGCDGDSVASDHEITVTFAMVR